MCMIHIYIFGVFDALRNYDLSPLFSVVQVRAHMPFAGCWFGSTLIIFQEIHLAILLYIQYIYMCILVQIGFLHSVVAACISGRTLLEHHTHTAIVPQGLRCIHITVSCFVYSTFFLSHNTTHTHTCSCSRIRAENHVCRRPHTPNGSRCDTRNVIIIYTNILHFRYCLEPSADAAVSL